MSRKGWAGLGDPRETPPRGCLWEGAWECEGLSREGDRACPRGHGETARRMNGPGESWGPRETMSGVRDLGQSPGGDPATTSGREKGPPCTSQCSPPPPRPFARPCHPGLGPGPLLWANSEVSWSPESMGISPLALRQTQAPGRSNKGLVFEHVGLVLTGWSSRNILFP